MSDDVIKRLRERAQNEQTVFAYRDLVNTLQQRCEGLEARIGKAIHYPHHWDTVAYPTLKDAIYEIADGAELNCTVCQRLAALEAGREVAVWYAVMSKRWPHFNKLFEHPDWAEDHTRILRDHCGVTDAECICLREVFCVSP